MRKGAKTANKKSGGKIKSPLLFKGKRKAY